MVPVGRGLSRLVRRFSSTTTLHPVANAESTVNVLGRAFERDSMTNVNESILRRLGNSRLLATPSSPLCQLWQRIQHYFARQAPVPFSFHHLEDPVVKVAENFDALLIPPSHPSRSPHDSYYINREWMLRTHMTSHERQLMQRGERRFLLVGDVYRRDEIDATHMPIFHQVEGVRLFTPDELLQLSREHSEAMELDRELVNAVASQGFQSEHDPRLVNIVLGDLYRTLNGLLRHFFGAEAAIRWQETFFPFTQPSIEAEVLYNDRWIEIVGSGILQQAVVTSPEAASGDASRSIGWAFGLGLERLAMILHAIPDIRLFWSQDPRFSSQFPPLPAPLESRESLPPPPRFVPFSKYPAIARDLSFYLYTDDFYPNDMFEIIREVASDLVTRVDLVPGLPPRSNCV